MPTDRATNAAYDDDSAEAFEGTLMDGLEDEPPYPTAASEHLIRPWPDSVPKRGLTRQFAAALREGFDADPVATFGAREIDGVLIVAAVGEAARDLEEFVADQLGGCVERLEVEVDA